jgi:hypothetical protein
MNLLGCHTAILRTDLAADWTSLAAFHNLFNTTLRTSKTFREMYLMGRQTVEKRDLNAFLNGANMKETTLTTLFLTLFTNRQIRFHQKEGEEKGKKKA